MRDIRRFSRLLKVWSPDIGCYIVTNLGNTYCIDIRSVEMVGLYQIYIHAVGNSFSRDSAPIQTL